MSVHTEIKKVTTETFKQMKLSGEKISMLTAYDFSMARLADEGGVDSVYSAEQTAAHLRKKYPQAEVILNHLNSANWKLKNNKSTLNTTL